MEHLRSSKQRKLLVLGWMVSTVPCLALAQAQESGELEPLAIGQAVAEAIDRNLDLFAERYKIPIAEARIVTAKLRPNPVVSLWGNYLDILGTGFNAATNAAGPTETGARVDFVLERGGKRRERIAVAEASKTVSQFELLNATRTLIVDVQSSLVDVLQAKADLTLAVENLKTFEEIVRVNASRVKSGDLAEVELIRSQVAQLQFENTVRQAELRLQTARVRLQLLVGRRCGDRLVDAIGKMRRDVTPLSLEALRERAFAQRPDVYPGGSGNWVVVPRLLQVAGVADVVSFGGLVKQYQIEIDPYKLERYKLSVTQIAEAVNANNRNAGGSLLDNRQQALVVRGVGLIQSVDDLGNVLVTSSAGVPTFIRDVGRVTIGAAPQTGILGVNETSGGVEGIVLMRRWENPSEVLSRIKEAVAELNRTQLPSGVQIVPIHDRTDLVNNTLHTVGRTLTEALVIVVTLLLFTFGSVKAAVLTAITIPLSLLFAFTCVYFQGIPGNLLSIGALDFGIIVDGTLVMVEHVAHRLSEREMNQSSPRGPFETIRDSGSNSYRHWVRRATAACNRDRRRVAIHSASYPASSAQLVLCRSSSQSQGGWVSFGMRPELAGVDLPR